MAPILCSAQSVIPGKSETADQQVLYEIEKLEKIAENYFDNGDFILAEKSYLEAKKRASKTNDLELEFNITKNYLNRFINISSLANGIEMALELNEKSRGKDSLLFETYSLIIQLYGTLGIKKEERKIMSDSMLVIAEKMDDNRMLQKAYFNLGTSTNGDEAIRYYRKTLTYTDWENDKSFIGSILNNLSARYRVKGDLTAALQCADSAFVASQESGRKEGMAAAKIRAAEAFYFMKKYQKAIENAKEALQIFKDAGILRRQDNCAEAIYASYKELGNYKEALRYFEMKVNLTDSLHRLMQLQESEFVDRKFAYELTQKRDSVNMVQERELNTLKMENLNNVLSKERMQKYLLYGGSSIVLVFAVFLWIGFQRKKKDNSIIEHQKELVEEKNKEITDSIQYAKRIQSAILPPDKVVKKFLPDSFVLYKPKDIVAGDFYWLEILPNPSEGGANKTTSPSNSPKGGGESPFPLGRVGDGIILFAAADCTGHGVPGAMVSVVCNNALNRSVREHGLTDPGEILDKSREIVIQEFEKSHEEVKDGMDIALCKLEISEDKSQRTKLQYAGAHNPLWIIREGEMIEIKADKQPIGKFDNPKPYTTHTFDLKQGDTIYVFSDGYVDQFGGEQGKKFKTKAFKELLLSIQHKNMEDQKALLHEIFEAWKGNLDQIDDVCIIGVRI